MKNLWIKYAKVISAIALFVTTMNVNSACYWITHQEELPQDSKKLRKF